MIKLLFWNIYKKPLDGLLALLANEHCPDVIILAECPAPVAQFIERFNSAQKSVVYRFVTTPTQGIVVLTRPPTVLKEIALEELVTERNGRVGFYRLTPFEGPDLLLVGLHLLSKQHLSRGEQTQMAGRTRRSLDAIEQHVNHRRTVVIGDFNMDPFESGMISAEGFHAVMDRKLIAKKGGQRILYGASRYFFCNPMWSLLGDESPGPPGTYYFEGAVDRHYWHTFDQVLLRPDLLRNFKSTSVRVLTSAGATALLNAKGVPDKKKASDHLPLLVIL